jgi:small subunit ribosomal protein S17
MGGRTHNHLLMPRKLVGLVIGTAMDRTAVVAVQRFFVSPRTRKIMRHVSKFFAHDHHELCGVGDRVQIEHWGPISRKKHHTVVDIVQRHPQLDGEPFPMSRLQRPPGTLDEVPPSRLS